MNANQFLSEYTKLISKPLPNPKEKEYTEAVSKRLNQIKELQTKFAEGQDKERRERRLELKNK